MKCSIDVGFLKIFRHICQDLISIHSVLVTDFSVVISFYSAVLKVIYNVECNEKQVIRKSI